MSHFSHKTRLALCAIPLVIITFAVMALTLLPQTVAAESGSQANPIYTGNHTEFSPTATEVLTVTYCSNPAGIPAYQVPHDEEISIHNFPPGTEILDVNVSVNITDTFGGCNSAEDYDLNLISPAGSTQLMVGFNNGGSCMAGPETYIDATFDDEAAQSHSNVCINNGDLIGDVQPQGDLSNLDGVDVINGEWFLIVEDTFAACEMEFISYCIELAIEVPVPDCSAEFVSLTTSQCPALETTAPDGSGGQGGPLGAVFAWVARNIGELPFGFPIDNLTSADSSLFVSASNTTGTCTPNEIQTLGVGGYPSPLVECVVETDIPAPPCNVTFVEVLAFTDTEIEFEYEAYPIIIPESGFGVLIEEKGFTNYTSCSASASPDPIYCPVTQNPACEPLAVDLSSAETGSEQRSLLIPLLLIGSGIVTLGLSRRKRTADTPVSTNKA